MYDKADPESQPLAGHIDASDDELTPSETRFPQSSLPVRSGDNLCMLCALFFTSAISCIIGLYLGGRLVNLDARCATYTTQYCM